MRTTDQYSFNDQPGIAVFIAEGVEQAKSQEEFIAAWQYLYDSGTVPYTHLTLPTNGTV